MTKELTLPSGKIAKIENGKGYDLLQAQIKAKTPDEIPYALIAELVEIDEQKLVYEDILELDLADVVVLQGEISGKFLNVTAQKTETKVVTGVSNLTSMYYLMMVSSIAVIIYILIKKRNVKS